MNVGYILEKSHNSRLTLALTLGISIASYTSPAYAQQATPPATIRLSPEDLERGQYGAQHNFFFLPPGKIGEDNYQSAGFFGQKLRPYLGNNAEALSELASYRSHKTFYLADKLLLASSVIVYATQVFKEDKAQYFNGVQAAAAGTAAVSLLATLFINRTTNEHLKRAVSSYNAGLASGSRGALWPRLRPAGVGLAATPQGQPVLALRWQL
jgi:hypothetical protein